MPRGFSLVQLLVGLLLNTVLLLCVCHALVMLHRGLALVSQYQSMLQSTVMLHSLLQQQLPLGQFFAGLSPSQLQPQQTMDVTADCRSSDAGGSFPTSQAPWAALYIASQGRQSIPSCIATVVRGSDVLQIKRFAGEPLDSPIRGNRVLFWQTPWQRGWLDDTPAAIGSEFWPYVHEVYYLSPQSGTGVLMRKRLIRQANQSLQMDTDSLMDGIDMLVFEVGVDDDNDGAVDRFLLPSAVPATVWRQQRGVVRQLRYFAVIRSKLADPRYVNRQVFSLGQRQYVAPADHFRRVVVHSSVAFLIPARKEME